jgi:hypothetical protein
MKILHLVFPLALCCSLCLDVGPTPAIAGATLLLPEHWNYIAFAGSGSGGKTLLSTSADSTLISLAATDDQSRRQRWGIRSAPNGTYNIIVRDSGEVRYLGSDASVSRLQLANFDDGSGRQRWKIEYFPNGVSNIQLAYPAAAARGYLTLSGDKLVLTATSMDKSSAQTWRIRPIQEVSLRSVNLPTYYVRHRNALGELTTVATDLDKRDASFFMVISLAGGSSISFESVNFPGHYLRHQGGRIKLDKPDGTDLFRKDASFNQVKGLVGINSSSFVPVNFPDHYLRHCSEHLYIDKNAGNPDCNQDKAVFAKDVSFTTEVAFTR